MDRHGPVDVEMWTASEAQKAVKSLSGTPLSFKTIRVFLSSDVIQKRAL
jgi:RNA recognition motif-containing protein